MNAILGLATIMCISVIALAACSPSYTPTPEPTPTPTWYEGGTLHGGLAIQWVEASTRDRLATSADFAAAALEGRYSTTQELRLPANEMRNCIDAVVLPEPELPNQQIAEIAALRAFSLGWR